MLFDSMLAGSLGMLSVGRLPESAFSNAVRTLEFIAREVGLRDTSVVLEADRQLYEESNLESTLFAIRSMGKAVGGTYEPKQRK